MATEYLQAIDDGRTVTDIDGLLDRIERRAPGSNARVEDSAAVMVGVTARAENRADGVAYLIGYEGNAVRNTTVNNIAYGAGYLSNSTTPADFARNLPANRAASTPTASGTGNS